MVENLCQHVGCVHGIEISVMFFGDDEHSTIFGGRFVRVAAEPVEEWCEVPICDEWVEFYEWQPCGLKECYQRVRECVSTHLIVRRC